MELQLPIIAIVRTSIALILLKTDELQVEGLMCYRCAVQPSITSYKNDSAPIKHCSTFDYSEPYQVECLHSTFCLKKTFQLEIQNGKKISVSERDCAPQTATYQSLRNGKWQMETSIDDEIYTSGCHEEESFGVKSSTSEYCYCDRNLCNGAESSRDPPSAIHHTDTMAVIFIFNAMKYIRSLR